MNPLLARIFALAALAAVPAAQAAGAVDVRIVDAHGAPVADAVVVAVPAAGPPPLPAKPRIEVVDQVEKEFVPRVKPILQGSLVAFPNKDNIRHQVYSFSPAKTFELPLYAGTQAAPQLFDKPGVVTLGCNIHDWMVGYIYVAESPYYGKTDDQGRTTVDDLPPGVYAVRVWHAQMAGSESATYRSLSVADGSHVAAQWSLSLKPEIKVPRTPAADAASPY